MNDSWQASVVLIASSDRDESHFGTGFVIYKNEQTTYLLTCAHVVRDVGGPGKIEINGTQAGVIAASAEEGADLAVLSLARRLDMSPLPLYAAGKKGKPFRTAGFQFDARRFLIRELSGTLGKQVGVQMRGQTDRISAWDLEITDNHLLQPGYSGSPVVDEYDHVIGVVNTRQGEGKTGVAISIETLKKVWQGMPSNLFEQSRVDTIEKRPAPSRPAGVVEGPREKRDEEREKRAKEAFGKLSPSMDAPERRKGPAVLGGKAEHKRENDLAEEFALSYTLSSAAPSSLAVSSDGLLLVSGGISQGTTEVWNMRTQQIVYKIQTGNYEQAVAISPDTHLLAGSNALGLPITSTKEKIKVWDTRTGNLLYTFAEHEYAVTSLAFTPDSQALVSGSFDAVKLWDLRAGLLLHTFPCSCLTSLAINSDGLILSSDCLDDQKIKVRNAQTGQVLYMLPGLSGSVRYTAISPDGRTFVGSSNSEAIKIWDMQTSKLLYTLERGPDTLLSLAISSDRQTLIKAFESKIEVWEKRERRLTKRPGDDVDIKALTDRWARLSGITKLENKRE